jgi:hypothetical protein
MELRDMLAKMARLRWALTLHEMVQDRGQSELRQLLARQKREVQLERSAPAENDFRRTTEALKEAVGSRFTALAQELRERGRRAGLRNGEMAVFSGRLISSLRGQDLEYEEVGRKIRLRLRDAVEQELKERFSEGIKLLIDGDIAATGAALAALTADIEHLLTQSDIRSTTRMPLAPSPLPLWQAIDEGLILDIKYRGELPKRGLLQRLGEGRRVLFVFLMVGSLVGGFMGFNVRRAPGMGWVFLALFLIVVGYTFYSWRTEDRDNLETELAKLRDALTIEFSRLLQDALRERQARVQAVLDELRREVVQVLDAVMRETAANATGDADDKRSAARMRVRSVEARLKELQTVTQTIARQRGLLERFLGEAAAELQAARLALSGAP